jgi:hypothetical protein
MTALSKDVTTTLDHLQDDQPFPQQSTMQVSVELLPLPADFTSRLAQIYNLALQRYREYQPDNQEE